MDEESPFNTIPPVILGLFLVVAAVEITLSLGQLGLVGGPGAVGWRLAALQDYAVSPAVLEQVLLRGTAAPELMMRFVTYVFVHSSFTQGLFGAALLLALGKFVGEVMHWGAVLGLFLATSIIGAVVFCLIAEGTTPLFGIYPPVYGLIGAFTYLLWVRLGARGENRVQAFRLIGFLLGIQLVWGALFGGPPFWIAEVAAFATGFGLSILLAPGGWDAFLARMRQRG